MNHLALSGGGGGGAYGAGLLNAWSARGDRPEFHTVTGVSTGSIIAVFAYLGVEYDRPLKHFYTKTEAKDLYELISIFDIFNVTGVLDTHAFETTVRQTITPEMLSSIADERKKGRLLLVATTNLDAQKPVIWDMGKIAQLGSKESEALFEDVIIASSSIPGAFPAKMINTTHDGEKVSEMHVDGGTTNQVFLYPHSYVIDTEMGDKLSVEHDVFVIRNSQLAPEWSLTDITLPAVASRSLDTVLKYQGRLDVERIYNYAQSNDMTFKLAYIDDGFEYSAPDRELVTAEYMSELYNYAYKRMMLNRVWKDKPDYAK
nr:patatin-like phospholipase family protein [Vibrio crassostreae]